MTHFFTEYVILKYLLPI
ncbi:TPA: stress response small protein YobI [Escherichia coli]|nr:hypothetical protein [Escherichia coli]MBW9309534.1 hypothetical protein [Escherichia coli]HAW6012181.1 hypothetical protein [Escherichia coli]